MSATRRTSDQTALQGVKCLLATSFNLSISLSGGCTGLLVPLMMGTRGCMIKVTRKYLGPRALQGHTDDGLMGTPRSFYNMRQVQPNLVVLVGSERQAASSVWLTSLYLPSQLLINQKLIEGIGEFSKVSEDKVNIQKSAHNWKKGKHITILLIKNTNDLRQLKNIAEMKINHWKDRPYSQIGRLIIITMSILLKLIFRFNVVLIKFLTGLKKC